MKKTEKYALVVGAGLSGLSSVKLLLAKGWTVRLTDHKPVWELAMEMESLKSDSLTWFTGEQPLKLYQRASLIVVSPGVSINHPGIEAARREKVEVVGELELAARNQPLPILAATGSNGKTTCISLAGHILEKARMRPFVGGNIGEPLAGLSLDFMGPQKPEFKWAVLEVSSFQLETVKTFKARAAAFLNLSPDHLDRHGDMAGYFQVKCRIFENQGSDDLAVLNWDEPVLRGKNPKGRCFYFSHRVRPDFGAYVEGQDNPVIRVVDGKKVLSERPWSDFQLWGAHNQENLMAAVGLALGAGLTAENALDAATDFVVGDHRLHLVGQYNLVSYYDDSKGTNVGAVIKALENFNRPVILIAGGRNKGLDFRSLRPAVAKRVKHLILIGESRFDLKKALSGAASMTLVENMAAAVAEAKKRAVSGEAVLLSPGCASFDQYRNYKERGDDFANEVKKQVGEGTSRC